MNSQDIEAAVRKVLADIAPEADLATLDPDTTFHDQFGLDSMDFINLIGGLDKTLGVDIAEEDYYQLATLHGCIAYLSTTAAREDG